MASAYELMLVLRGRNYLSNDLRRAGADIARLRSAGQVSNARSQLAINAQRLANTRSIAQQEVASLTTGTRRLALDKATHAYHSADLTAQKNLSSVQKSLLENQAAQVANAERLKAIQAEAAAFPAGSPMAVYSTANQAKLIEANRALTTGEIQLNHQLALAQENMVRVNIAEQQLIETEAAHAHRLEVLNERILTTNAAIELNDIKLAENALAMRRLPLEQLAARAKYVEHLGRAFQTLGLIATAALGFAAHAAAKFDTEITLAATQSTLTTNNTVRQVQKNAVVLQNAVRNMLTAGATPFKPDELSQSLYTIFSGLSLQGNQAQQLKEGTQILREFNKVAVANYGQVKLNDVTKLGIALINNFKLSVSQLPSVLNRAQASVRFGAMTMNDLTSSLNQVIPAFKAAGYSANQMFADVAFLSRVFPSLRIGTTGLSRLTETFAKYHDVISQNIGVNIAPGGHLSPVAQIVQEIIKAHPQLVKGGVDLQNWFKSVTGASQFVNARRVFQAYVTRIALYHDVAGKVLHDNNELTKSFADMSQTPQVRWAEFTNQLRGLVLEIGTAALPVFQKMSGPIKDAVHWFDTLSPSTRKLVGEIAVFISVGALLGGTLLVVVGAATRLYAVLKLLGVVRMVKAAGGVVEWAAKSKTALAGLEGEAGFVSARMALGLGIPGLIVTMIVFHKQVSAVVHALGGWTAVLNTLLIAMTALKFAPMILGMLGIATEANTAAAGVGGLRLAVLALGGPEVLIALAAVLAALLAIDEITHHTKGHAQTGGSAKLNTEVFEQYGKYYERITVGRNVVTKRITKQQADAILTTKKQANDLKAADDAFKKSGLGYLTDVNKTQKHLKDTIVKGATTSPNIKVPQSVIDTTSTARGASRSVQQWISLLEQARKKMLGAPGDVQAAQRYEHLVAALNKQFKNQPDLLAAINDVLGNYDSNLKKATTSAQTLGVTTQDVLSSLKNMYDNFLSQETSAFGTLFQGPFVNAPAQQNNLQWGGMLTGGDLTKDLRSQITQFRRFHGQIDELSRRGAPRELVKQLEALGPSALKQIEALNKLSPNALRGYFKLFQTAQRDIHSQTMRDLNRQLAQYRKYGRNIALQIVAGLRDENVPLTNYLKKLITRMFPGLPTGETGAGGRPTHHKPPAHTVVHNTTYHVVAPKSNASIKAQVRHAEFVKRHKYVPHGGMTK